MLTKRLIFINSRNLLQQFASSSTHTISALNAGYPLPEESYAKYMERCTASTKHWSDRILPLLFQRVRDRLIIGLMMKNAVDKATKMKLDMAIVNLYQSCANGIPYPQLIKEFGLNDHFSSWFIVTMLHNWAICTRLSTFLNASSYLYFQRTFLGSFWNDTDKRFEIVRNTDPNYVGTGFFQSAVALHSLHLQMLIDLDEGFLGNDQDLAASVWRSIYCQDEFRPIYVNNVVKYIRQTMLFLHNMDAEALLEKGLSRWDPAEEIKLKHISR